MHGSQSTQRVPCGDGRYLYHGDSNWCSVGTIKIIAQCSLHAAREDENEYGKPPQKASEKKGPPPSFRDPFAVSNTSAHRPRSMDLGQKARGAVMDLGKAARESLYNIRNLSKNDVATECFSESGPNSIAFSPSMQDTNELIPSFAKYTPGRSQNATDDAKAGPVPSWKAIKMRTTYRIKQDLVNQSAQSPLIPLTFIAKTEKKLKCLDGHQGGGWQEIKGGRVDFATQSDISTHNNDDLGWISSSDEAILTSTTLKSGTQDILLVRPPSAELVPFLRAKPQSTYRETISLKVQLIRSALVHEFTRSPRLTPNGPRSPKANGGSPYFQNEINDSVNIVFVCTDSSQKLLKALDSTVFHNGRHIGPLASYEEARLEGIEWALINFPKRCEDVNFEWTLPDTSRRPRYKDYEQQKKCTCAVSIPQIPYL